MESLASNGLQLIKLAIVVLATTLWANGATFVVVNTNDSGGGSLRQAIQEANSNDQDDTITFDPVVFASPTTIQLTSGQFFLARDDATGSTKTISIIGPGAHLLSLDGNNNSRIFQTELRTQAFIYGLTLTRGNGTVNGPIMDHSRGGAILVNGGGLAEGLFNLTIKSCVIKGNTSVIMNGTAGAISLIGRLRVQDSAIIDNRATTTSGGIDVTNARAEITNSTISRNIGGSVGGMLVSGPTGEIRVTNSTVAFNESRSPTSQVGGVRTDPFVVGLIPRNSIFAGNIAPVPGGRDINGRIGSPQNNIIGWASGFTIVGDLGGNQIGVDPKIAPGASLNGSGVPGHQLLPDSPAIDRGVGCVISGSCIDPPVLLDHRGVTRPQDGDGDGTETVDIGSFEALRAEALAAPVVAPDLRATSDSGIFNDDDITATAPLVFDISGLESGATVELLRNGTVVTSEMASGNSVVLSDKFLSQDGIFGYSVRQRIGPTISLPSPALTVIFDTTGPMVTSNQAVGQGDPTNTLPVLFDIKFNEVVHGFTLSDVSLSGSTANVSSAVIGLSGSGPSFVVSVGNVLSEGTIVVSLPAGTCEDLAGNSAFGSNSVDNIITYDITPPTATIDQGALQADPTGELPINFTLTFSEPVTGLTGADISLAGSTADVSAATKIITGSGFSYNLAVGNITANGSTVVATLPALGVQDAAGNTNLASTSSDNVVTLDNVGPSVTINKAAGQPDPTNVLPVNYTIVFSEPVAGFAADDISFAGSTGMNTSVATKTLTGSGTTYNLAVDGINSNGGTLFAHVVDGAATDGTGNPSLISTSEDNGIRIDNARPFVSINQATTQTDPTTQQPVVFTAQFNESVVGLSSAGVSLAGSTADVSNATVEIAGSGTHFSVRVSNIRSAGRVRASIVAGAAVDLIGNPNNASTSVDNSVMIFFGASTFDFDGDRRTDFSVFRPSSGAWYLQRSTAGFQGLQFGATGDKLTPADYDGDGKTDIAVYRPSGGQWYVLNSATNTVAYPVFGAAEDLPAPGDFDGDGKADLVVFRPSQGIWYRVNSSNGSFFAFPFGQNGDVPTVGDFDGDGKNDYGIFRPSIGDWYNVRSSNSSLFGERFGQPGDKIAPADYDGDGKTDIAIFRPSTGLWVVRNSATATYSYSVFGAVNDVPISADYDGDGKADIGVWRPSDGTWYIQRSSNGSFLVFPWGQNGDVPTPSAFGN